MVRMSLNDIRAGPAIAEPIPMSGLRLLLFHRFCGNWQWQTESFRCLKPSD